jgi:hypothetical protein
VGILSAYYVKNEFLASCKRIFSSRKHEILKARNLA